jgi:hypothetical protein
MMSYTFKRRSFLQACGGSAVLLAPLLRSIEAQAQGMTAPLRLLILHHPLGAASGLATWRPNASATTTSFTLPSETAPFAAAGLQPYMCMVDGLNTVFATRSPSANSGQNTHERPDGGLGCHIHARARHADMDHGRGVEDHARPGAEQRIQRAEVGRDREEVDPAGDGVHRGPA